MLSFNSSINVILSCSLIFSNILPGVLGHDYIKYWSPDNGKTFEKGHKQPLAKTALRDVSENTGWIGSQFLTNPAITCGSSSTPSQKIAPPGGKLFSDASQSAGKTMAVQPGASVHLIVADDPGKGTFHPPTSSLTHNLFSDGTSDRFPHDNGHIQTYLAYCGESPTACQDFDAASVPYFKIQAERDVLSNKKKFPMNKARDGNEWAIPIPDNLPKGSYILRSEIICLNQGTEAEGKQDQYYITCGQISLSDPTSGPVDLSKLETVKFPGAYNNGKLDPASKTLPGPALFTPNSETESNVVKGAVRAVTPTAQSPTEAAPKTPPNAAVAASLNDTGPQCAKFCLRQNLQLTPETLAPACGSNKDPNCLCADTGFVQAFINCARDHCQESQIIFLGSSFITLSFEN
ncbi:family 61 glycoside hydrolase [Melampsora larici-populina 98AG31]|uniref:lytic cellulose monooxygenase (C4-dehydrogenating) n=1 Tax=Melampsora larici-populina (strain 98AG31 / pathotype 3-4-7) TaxID=747676 RepID=F4RPA0_MELLP|nr:family 61 glycoside hydrolase [Melampsora larici-populina 98AG31]EGG05780.1 family 61 glycoside hydrolase [Melampsora larici-populina 98AG31]